MKKPPKSGGNVPLWRINYELKMKFSLLFFLTISFLVQANSSYAQRTKISLDKENTTLREVLDAIESKTEFKFFYHTDAVNLARRVTIKTKKATIGEVLRKLFKGEETSYELDDRKILLRRNEKSADPERKVFVLPDEQEPVTGKVTDESGLPLAGANIVEKGTVNGTQTDFDGNFSIILNDPSAELTVSYIGFETQDVPVNGQKSLAVILQESAAGLEEVVVIGYGTQTKKDLTGSVSVIDGAAVESRSVTNVSNALQGAVAGVSVTRSGSAPGSGSNILIRGVTTLQGASAPLVLVDNVPVSNIDDVNPDQIESISILKDGAAASIYGSRAAAGVVIITTKRAKSGVFSLGYSGEYMVNTPTELRGTVSAIPYMRMDNEKSWNDNGNGENEFPLWPQDLIENYPALNAQNPDQYPDFDWRSLILRKSSSGYRHNITMSGGTEKLKTNINVGYEFQDALYNHRDWKRYTARVNNDIKISEKFGGNVDFALKITKDDQPVIDPTSRAIQSGPIYAPIWQDGRIAESKSGDNTYARLVDGGFSSSDSYLIYGMASVWYKPIEELKISVNLAPNFEFNKYKSFNRAIPYWAATDPEQLAAPGYISNHNEAQRRLTERRANTNTLTTQALVNYDKSFGNNNISGVIGYEEFSNKFERLSVQGNEFVSNDYPFLNQAPIDKVFNETGGSGTSFSENAYSSYFGRLEYNYDNTYYLQGTVRRDGSSRFGKDYRWGTFPSVSLGWVISNEGFMQSLDPAISFLKFRTSYGSLGNDRLGNYLYQSVLQFSDVLLANGSNVEAVRAAAQRFLAIEDVTWETTTSLNFGIDLNMFNSRLSLTADYFKKETTDMLLDLSIPSLSGYDDPTVNVGSMDSDGWEIALGWKDQIGDWRYSITTNFFDSQSIIGDVRGKRIFEYDDRLLSETGVEYQSWYGYQSDGLFQTQDEVDASPVTSDAVGPGDIKYKDISGPEGVPDGVINELDRTVLDGSLPRYQYGGTFNLNYKNFDLGLTFQGVGKQSFYLAQNYIRPFLETWLSPSFEYADSYWSVYNSASQNQSVKYPRLSENASSNNYRFSDYWLVDGSYLRIKNLTFGYTLPSDIFGDSGFSKLRIYISGNDIFTFDNLIDGIDPEQNLRFSGYLINKSFLLGVKANF
ncbi:SusC/RagA family TonB-linked outer membrane protein [Euzebyella marina]|uniref:SusC/RagA family TonB-linked outer membrane protein n=1 Tax=Euzebyella marina TaxID=1761453 RepID=A0A3G2L3A0_9FLAO|nr:TonB-dependent receptor [Euzebyella marina]AYN66698.1 SusC/RagA family TonB-linked outer membrane protein [Euzebyella marina]